MATVNIPQKTWAQPYPSAIDIAELLQAIRQRNLPREVYQLFADLGAKPPVVRLAHNLQKLLALNAKGPVDNVLTNGLLDEERAALCVLDNALLPRYRETAHGLLNIHDRWHVMKATRKLFETSRTCNHRYYEPKTLDHLLGMEGDSSE